MGTTNLLSKQDYYLKAFGYLFEIFDLFLTGKHHTINIYLIGSRMSGKTIQIIFFIYVCGYNEHNLRCKTDFWRHEAQGSQESFDEAIDFFVSNIHFISNRSNTNMTRKQIKLPFNEIRFRGYKSNTKKKAGNKVGIARKGGRKDIQINVLEEITEFSSWKEIELIKQASGGAKLTINIHLANPWILSMFYVKFVNKYLPFNKRILINKGQQFKVIDLGKKLMIFHITNHRVNTFLAEGQHQSLIDLKDIDKTLWEVADLGMPGVAEGLIYAPIMNLIKDFAPMPVEEFRAGLDLGTATGPNGSATHLILGYMGNNYRNLMLMDEWRHSNSEQYYLTDAQMLDGIVDKLEQFVKDNLYNIRRSSTGVLKVFYDNAALYFKSNLVREIKKRTGLSDYISVKPSAKYRIPVRINCVKDIISSGRLYMRKDKLKYLWEELEGSMWDDTKLVDGLPTRQKIKDHGLDAMEYMIGSKLPKYMKEGKLKWDKRIRL